MNWKNGLRWFLAILVFVVAVILKLHNYDRVPEAVHGEELLYAWSGQHLIETGVPVSWSTLNYPKKYLVFDGIVGEGSRLTYPATLWRPWLDEPPLYSLLSGGAAHLYGADRNKVPPASFIRTPSVIASILTSAAVLLVAWSFFGYWIGIVSLIFYGFTPIFVFGSRLSVPENMVALAILPSMWLARRYLKDPKTWIAVCWGFTAAILGLMKPTGFFLAPLAIFIALKKKRWLDALIIGLVTGLGVAAFLAYGYHYDWELFKIIVSVQGQRFAGWSGLAYIFNSPAYDIFHYYDGWYVFAMLSMIYYTFRINKRLETKILLLFFFYFLVVALLSGSEGDLLPWYRYPLFPILAVFGALGLRSAYRRANFFTVVMVVGLLLTSRFMLSNAFRPTTPALVFRIFFFVATVPSLIYFAYGKRWGKAATRLVIIGFFALAVFFNSRLIYSSFEVRCESISCPFDQGTALSETKMPFFWRFLSVPLSTDMLTTKRPWF